MIDLLVTLSYSLIVIPLGYVGTMIAITLAQFFE